MVSTHYKNREVEKPSDAEYISRYTVRLNSRYVLHKVAEADIDINRPDDT